LGLNSGLHACKAEHYTAWAIPPKPILLWLFWRWWSHKLFAWAGWGISVLLISASQVARIACVSHLCPVES
jgi:hypothetical protein